MRRPRQVTLLPRWARRGHPLRPDRSSVLRDHDYWVRVHRRPGPTGGAGPVFVLLHGIAISSRYYLPLAAELAHHGTVYLVDLPGFAGLPRPRRALDVTDFAALVAGVLAAEEVTGAVLVGQSMGAQIATELLVTRPDLAAGAVLVGPTTNAARRRTSRQALDFARSSLHEGGRVSAIALRAYASCGPRWFRAVLPAMLGYPIEERIRQVTGPVALVRGEHDDVAPSPWLEVLTARAGAGGPAPRVVAGAAHSVIYDHPRAVAGAALEVHAGAAARDRG